MNGPGFHRPFSSIIGISFSYPQSSLFLEVCPPSLPASLSPTWDRNCIKAHFAPDFSSPFTPSLRTSTGAAPEHFCFSSRIFASEAATSSWSQFRAARCVGLSALSVSGYFKFRQVCEINIDRRCLVSYTFTQFQSPVS